MTEAEESRPASADKPRVEIEVRRRTTNVVSFRLTDEEMDLVEAEADRRGLRLSQYVRSVLLGATNAPPREALEVSPGGARTFHYYSTMPAPRSKAAASGKELVDMPPTPSAVRS